MSERKSFWSSVPGLVTGLAGLLTGVVGLVTVLIQLNVIGGDDPGSPPAAIVPTTVAPATGGSPSTTISGQLKADPGTLKLAATEREKTLTVRNASTAMVTVLKPQTTGKDPSAFKIDEGCTGQILRPGSSCTVKVTVAPNGPLRTYTASVVLEAKELSQVTEVPVEATAIL